MSKLEQMVGSREAAKIANTTQTTINRWVKIGRLVPAVTVPGYKGARLFRREDVLAVAQPAEQESR